MNASDEDKLPVGTTSHFANMHNWLRRALYVCLTVLVIEASFSLPGLLIWFGWPTLTVSEVCHELMKVRWGDDDAECLIPHPLYGANEGEGRGETAPTTWGIQPRPEYKRIGYRDLVKFRDERLEREAAAREAAERNAVEMSQLAVEPIPWISNNPRE